MSIYVWSDTHFNHRGIIDYCKRPYADVEGMNYALKEAWNHTVGSGDTIYLLGDFGFGNAAQLQPIFAALNGQKHLVIGNHDEKNPKVLALPWASKRDIVTLREEGIRAVACHYPMETWKNAHRGYLMLHGHSHGSLKRVLPHRFDVGADVFAAPVRLSELAAIAATQPFQAVDHHAENL